jgi:hypothetical protein
MKLVPENLNEIEFQRGRDPLDALNIGQTKIRGIKSAYDNISPLIRDMNADSINFRKFRKDVDKLRDTLDVIIVNHLTEKYNLKFEFIEPDELDHLSPSTRPVAKASKDGNYWVIYKNGPGNAFWITADIAGKFIRSKQSYELSTIDKKVGEIFRKYKLTI